MFFGSHLLPAKRSLVLGLVLLSLGIYIFSGYSTTDQLTTPSDAVKFAKDERRFTDDVTVVTAFINIGAFKKGAEPAERGPKEYFRWMKIWEKIKNGVVFVTNNRSIADVFSNIRRSTNAPTEIVLMDTDYENASDSSYWSVRLLPNLTTLFARPNYPKHYPNTVLPTYSMTMNLKFDSLETAIVSNPFSTNYFAWIDIGMYRDASMDEPCFRLVPPIDHDPSLVAMNEMFEFRNQSFGDIVRNNEVWVGGTAIFAQRDTMQSFVRQYKDTAERMIRGGWYSTDQQTIYSMYGDPDFNSTSHVRLQLYRFDQTRTMEYYNGDPWWYMGYLMRRNLRNCSGA